MISGQILDGKNIIEAQNLLQDGDGGSLPIVINNFSNESTRESTYIYLNDYGNGDSFVFVMKLSINRDSHSNSNDCFKIYGSESEEDNGYLVNIIGFDDIYLFSNAIGNDKLNIELFGSVIDFNDGTGLIPAALAFGAVLTNTLELALSDARFTASGTFRISTTLILRCIKLW